MRLTSLLFFALACGSSTNLPADGTATDPVTDPTTTTPPAPTTTGPTDTTGSGTLDRGWQCSQDVDEADLNGTYPNGETPAPDFVAFNRDGTERGQADLIGTPTVLWFYPIAGTSG